VGSLSSILRGRAWVVGDSVDTNQLAGGGLSGENAEETLRINCLRGLRPEFPDQVKAGDILVAGHNFGCGSSRQSAVEALQLSGIAAVLAESVARIHRRNSIALALPTFVVPGITAMTADGDQLEVDYPLGLVRNLTEQRTGTIPRLPPSVEAIYESGGLLNLLAYRLAHPADGPQERGSDL
jgi:3-isopropylmalate dehydratase small subunit